MKPYFEPARPRVLAHRGLAIDAPENTPLAFAKAIAAGARYVETDVQVSADGVAVIAHDPTLERVAGLAKRIDELAAADLARVDLGAGQRIVPLEEALHGFPDTRWNIDVKHDAAVDGVVRAIQRTGASDRVLVTSFSERRRRAAVAPLPGVATSASAPRFAAALLSGRIAFGVGLRRALAGIDAVQVPERALGLSTTAPGMIERLHRLGVEIHVWTVNDPTRIEALFDVGVDGVVTDRADDAVPIADRYTESPL